ncbi:formate dehydrogenase accessory sulfurtransferase FdhD [Methanospirillum sp. J.3.6.1-F.2.7.3]|uniref:Sulfur carrier protein FdhD n=1 Tax=Methanospirillum purgamenti TaxID=2834276 RepID=A0A8E7EJI2_9EURY|nr:MULTISPECIES: formate dehydrogenase accessory sulfurtransferase FdhD [Methanospirillum]MDX8548786.1 formate dehydrogenase accessory sulfurtransferase FdhD [Methanospirillum hungatei]QVV88485.1 formate dehydrogenase accessory sulfurtransferase FdhD [Methanospirillum sp. J.3.6.1-F.2.7.3]
MTQIDSLTLGITKEYLVIKAHGTECRDATVEVCTESRIIFSLNGSIVGDLSITPLDLEAFAIGYLICEGYICSREEIEKITINLPDISVKTNTGAVPSGQFSKNSSGGSCRELLPGSTPNPLPDGFVLYAETILNSMDKVNDYSVIWKRTGGMHCSLIIDEHGSVISGVEDMGRHTTVDKAVGMALIKGTDLSRCYLVCSGRLPVDMVAKAYRAGIPVMVSNNAAFAGGIDFAKKANMTLAGFVRPPNMTIYTGGQRILFP